jgi:hypothetical protein
MRAAGYSITENDPFEETPVIIFSERALSPYVNRMRMHWADMRGVVLETFRRHLYYTRPRTNILNMSMKYI